MSEQEVWRKMDGHPWAGYAGLTVARNNYYMPEWLVDAILRDHELAQAHQGCFAEAMRDQKKIEATEARIAELEAARTAELKVAYERITELEAALASGTSY